MVAKRKKAMKKAAFVEKAAIVRGMEIGKIQNPYVVRALASRCSRNDSNDSKMSLNATVEFAIWLS